MNLLSMLDFETKEQEFVFEATNTKGAAEYLQNAFNKAGLIIKVIPQKDNVLKCTGSLNRAKFSFIISLVNGKLNADFSGLDIDSMLSKPELKVGKDFRGGVQKFIVDADNAIADIRTVKTFLMRITRVLERITTVAQKNSVKKVNEAKAVIFKKTAPSNLTFSGVKEWYDDNHRDSDDNDTKVVLTKTPDADMDITELTDHLTHAAQDGVIKAARAKNRTWVLVGISSSQ